MQSPPERPQQIRGITLCNPLRSGPRQKPRNNPMQSGELHRSGAVGPVDKCAMGRERAPRRAMLTPRALGARQ
jgi:hypothetical protein